LPLPDKEIGAVGVAVVVGVAVGVGAEVAFPLSKVVPVDVVVGIEVATDNNFQQQRRTARRKLPV